MEKVIEVKGVSRNYSSVTGVFRREKKTVKALKDINFTVGKGEIFGILGPNGAGKTTLIKMMTTLLTPTEGQIHVLGHDVVKGVKALRPKINFVFGGERSLYWRLSAYDNMVFFSDLYLLSDKDREQRIKNLLKRVGLLDDCHRKVETFSKGMKQRLQIAKALLNEPSILYLDEPTIGLDPVGARMLKEVIKEISEEGTTVILTTHYMPEAEELCDRIAVINKGSLIALDSLDGIRTVGGHSKEASLEDIYVDMIGGVNCD